LSAALANTTYLPSALIIGSYDPLFASFHALSTLTLVIVLFCVSLTNISYCPFTSHTTRLSAALTNTTYLPSALIIGSYDPLFASFHALSTLTLVVVLFCVSLTNISYCPFTSHATRLFA
jgi:hypothetical protein